MPKLAPQNDRTKPKSKVDKDELDPKEVPQGDTTSSVGEKNVEGIQGEVGEEGKPDTDNDDKAPFVP